MKKLLIFLVIFLSYFTVQAQLQAVGTFRIANVNTAFGYSIPRGSTVYDMLTSQQYFIKNNIKYDKTLSQLTAGTDYVNYLPRTGGVMYGIIYSNSIIPVGVNSYDLGTLSYYYANIYSNNIRILGIGTFDGNVTVGSNLTVSGAETVTSTVTASDFILSSDSTLKKDIQPLTLDISKVPLIQFKFKADTTGRERFGIIAQTLRKYAPSLVYTGMDGKLKVAYIGFLVARSAYLEKKVNNLQTQLIDLAKRVKTLEDEK